MKPAALVTGLTLLGAMLSAALIVLTAAGVQLPAPTQLPGAALSSSSN